MSFLRNGGHNTKIRVGGPHGVMRAIRTSRFGGLPLSSSPIRRAVRGTLPRTQKINPPQTAGGEKNPEKPKRSPHGRLRADVVLQAAALRRQLAVFGGPPIAARPPRRGAAAAVIPLLLQRGAGGQRRCRAVRGGGRGVGDDGDEEEEQLRDPDADGLAAEAGAGGSHRRGAHHRAVEHLLGLQADRLSRAARRHLQPHRRPGRRQHPRRRPEEARRRLQRGVHQLPEIEREDGDHRVGGRRRAGGGGGELLGELHRGFRPAGRLLQHRRGRLHGLHLRHLQPQRRVPGRHLRRLLARRGAAEVHRGRLPAGDQPPRRRLLHVLQLGDLRGDAGEGGVRLHAGPHVRGVRAHAGESPDPQGGEDLRLQRGELSSVGRQAEGLHRLAQGARRVGEALLGALHRQPGRGFPPHAALRRHLRLPQRRQEQEREAPAALRVRPHELHRRAGRRERIRRPPSRPRHRAHRDSSEGSAVHRERGGGGEAREVFGLKPR